MLYKLTKERSWRPDAQKNFYRQGSSSNDGMSSTGTGTWADGVAKKVAEHVESEMDGTEEHREKEKVLNGNVLMVDQLWLWVINSREYKSGTKYENVY